MITETDLKLYDGRTLHVYDAGDEGAEARLTIFWRHAMPALGGLPEPLLPATAEHGIRWVSYDRPGYGGSTPHPGRDVAAAAADVTNVVDALGIGQFVVMGYSGGAPHALACGALLPERVLSMVCVAGPAPFHAEGLDWFGGMAPSFAAEMHAATKGRAALEDYLGTAEPDPELLIPADQAALEGPWSWAAAVSDQALEGGPEGELDDHLAYVAPWGFDPEQVRSSVLLLHGGQDRVVPSSHGEWLAGHIRLAALWRRPDDGHFSVLNSAATALDWLLGHASPD